MSILATAPSGGRRKGPGGRWEVYASGKGWVPEESLSLDELARLQEAPRAPQSAQEPPAEPDRRVRGKAVQVRIDGKWIAESCVQVWEAFGRLRSVSAVARELGMGQGNVSNRLQRYEAVFGVKRPEPQKPSTPTTRFETKGHTPAQRPPQYSDKAQNAANNIAAPARSEPLAEPAADHASVLHPPVDENVEPVEAADVFAPFEGQYRLGIDTFTSSSGASVTLVDGRSAYARGFAVATLRALAATDGLPEQLRDMASDAADGLMA